MPQRRRPSINKEIFSTLIALPLLHPHDCHAGLLVTSRKSLQLSNDGPPDAPHVEGYRLCSHFSEAGIVNLVADLISDDSTFNDDRSLCGWLYVGSGSGEAHAEYQANTMYTVLSRAMARVMCLNKDRSDAEMISRDLVHRLQRCVGIVSLRNIVNVEARGQFLEHETYCLASLCNVEDAIRIVKEALKSRRPVRESCESPTPMAVPVQAADLKAEQSCKLGAVINISDDEENSCVKRSPVSAHEPDNASLQTPVSEQSPAPQIQNQAHPPSSRSYSSRGESKREPQLTSIVFHPQDSQGRHEEGEGFYAQNGNEFSGHKGSVSGKSARLKLSINRGEQSPSDSRILRVEQTLKTLQRDLKEPPKEIPFTSLADAELAHSISSKPAQSGSDIRNHFAMATSHAKTGGSGTSDLQGDCHALIGLDIVPGYGAEVKGWHLQEPSFFGRMRDCEGVPMACLGGDSEDRCSFARVDWDKEKASEIWQHKFAEYETAYMQHIGRWGSWVEDVRKELSRGENSPVDGIPRVTRLPRGMMTGSSFGGNDAFTAYSTGDECNMFPLVVSRSVLATIVDISYGDTVHESIGLLFGEVNEEHELVRITDCKGMRRDVDCLSAQSVKRHAELEKAIACIEDDKTLVGWFHTHLDGNPLPSEADVECLADYAFNQQQSCGLICSFNAFEGPEDMCSRITFTAFRGLGKWARRVKWEVEELPGMTPKAVRRCFEGIKNAHAENTDLMQRSFEGTPSSVMRRRWLLGMWENYLIRLVQGTIPLLLAQIDQSCLNLRVQRARISEQLARNKLRPCPLDAASNTGPDKVGNPCVGVGWLRVNFPGEPRDCQLSGSRQGLNGAFETSFSSAGGKRSDASARPCASPAANGNEDGQLQYGTARDCYQASLVAGRDDDAPESACKGRETCDAADEFNHFDEDEDGEQDTLRNGRETERKGGRSAFTSRDKKHGVGLSKTAGRDVRERGRRAEPWMNGVDARTSDASSEHTAVRQRTRELTRFNYKEGESSCSADEDSDNVEFKPARNSKRKKEAGKLRLRFKDAGRDRDGEEGPAEGPRRKKSKSAQSGRSDKNREKEGESPAMTHKGPQTFDLTKD